MEIKITWLNIVKAIYKNNFMGENESFSFKIRNQKKYLFTPRLFYIVLEFFIIGISK